MKLSKALTLLPLFLLGFSTFSHAAEDCVSFNNANTTVQFVGGEWKIVDGSHWMFSFGANKGEAVKALQIIKAYRMNSSCFVGRPDPSFQYLLSNGRAPGGGDLVAGEDCISFIPGQVQIQYIAQSRTWKMVQGNMWMEDFGDKKQEAYDALDVVKKYGFNKQCFVGRPGPSFRYWRRG